VVLLRRDIDRATALHWCTVPTPSPTDDELLAAAVALAEALIAEADALETGRERRRRRRLARLGEAPAGVDLSLALADQVARIRDPRRAAARLASLVRELPITRALAPLDAAALALGALAAPRFPRAVIPLVHARLDRETSSVILPARDPRFSRHLRHLRGAGFRVNVNLLGEAILGEREALRRREQILRRIEHPDVDYVSVKISAVHSHISALAFDETVTAVADRLRPLFTAASRQEPAAFVNLDMEEYRDLHLTAAVFRRLLDEPALRGLDAGIVLQAYLPDSHDVLADLCDWALRRREGGGGRVKVRIVKGANLAMEHVEAELRGWPLATYPTKADTDASAKRLLDAALDERYADAVRVGVASHNLFDVAWALVSADRRGAHDRLELEMLEGMAPAAADAARHHEDVVLYQPVVDRGERESSLAYLARRLDENASEDNFLRTWLRHRPGDRLAPERARFVRSVADRAVVSTRTRRTQDRRLDASPTDPGAPFANEPDTDWTRPANRRWLADELASFERTRPTLVTNVVDGEHLDGPTTGRSIDPSRPLDPAAGYAWAQADRAQVDRAVTAARGAAMRWAASATTERRALLARVADELVRSRGRLIAAMVGDAGKTVEEADVEISEAVDFARYYASTTASLEPTPSARFEPFGVVVVAGPWNFPCSIPAGGLLAAVASGSAAICKPAPETVLTAWEVVACLHRAGVPTDLVQLVACADGDVGRHLVTHPDVDAVNLTGSVETGRAMRRWAPRRPLLAETSGKNALVITATADLDLAIADLVRSAFGHAGQKCSAASLAIVEASVIDDGRFLERLADAVESLRIGSAHELTTDVGPLIRPPEGPLRRALTELDEGERWLVGPRPLDDTGHLWSPGVKLGVRPGSWFHLTECFGPVLGVMTAPDLATAIAWQNQPAYGLTGGLHSLDATEVDRWVDEVAVGNAYVNRTTTGAILRRQPFGGWKASTMGATAKAGGPSLLASFGRWVADPTVPVPGPAELAATWRSMAGGADPSGLRVEANVLRHRPRPAMVLRVGGPDASPDRSLELALAAARQVGTPVLVSTASQRVAWLVRPLAAEVVVEDDDALCRRILDGGVGRLRLLGSAGDAVHAAAAEAAVDVDDHPVVHDARTELARWSREQVVSRTLHRYGRVPPTS
jgi:RHH-type proline utilization regulon transcriptional repressor/proline dehydrogenase/delta 1-pyrroline-5-carboxylate dehydrogenase